MLIYLIFTEAQKETFLIVDSECSPEGQKSCKNAHHMLYIESLPDAICTHFMMMENGY